MYVVMLILVVISPILKKCIMWKLAINRIRRIQCVYFRKKVLIEINKWNLKDIYYLDEMLNDPAAPEKMWYFVTNKYIATEIHIVEMEIQKNNKKITKFTIEQKEDNHGIW